MRAILIAFLFWHCCSHRMVSCTQTEKTTSRAGTTHSGVESTIAHVDRKDSAIVTDRDSVAKTIRSEIDVGQRPAVDTSLARSPKEPVPAKEAKTDVAGRENAESTAGTDFDISGRNSDSPSLRSRIASRDCDPSLNERCVSSDAGLTCACSQGNEQAKISKLGAGSDPNAQEYEAAKQQLTVLSDGAEDRNDSDDHVDPWKLYGAVPRRDVENDASDIDSVRAREARLLAEHRRMREETPQEVVSEKTAHAAGVLRSEDRELSQVSEKVLAEPETPTTVSTTGKSIVTAPAPDNQLINSILGEATALAVESPKALIPADSMNPQVMCPVLLPLQKPRDPAVDPCGDGPSPDGLKAALSDDLPISTHEFEAMDSVEPSAALENSDRTHVAGSQEFEKSKENSQAVPIQNLPIAPADPIPIPISGAPAPVDELSTNDSSGADISDEATVTFGESMEALVSEESVDAPVEAAILKEPSVSTGESHQELVPEGLPISADNFSEVMDPQASTDTEDDTSKNADPEKLVTPTNASPDVHIPELSLASAEEALDERGPAIPTEASSGDFIPNESGLLAEGTLEHQIAAALEDDWPHARLSVEPVTPSEESYRAAIPEEQGNSINPVAKNSKAVALGAPRSLASAEPKVSYSKPLGGEDSQKCTCFLDNSKTSHANSEAELKSERAAEMKTIGGNSSENLKNLEETSTPLFSTTGDSKTQGVAN